MAAAGLGDLGLWLHLRRQARGRLRNLVLPPGTGPLLLLAAPPEAEDARKQVTDALLAAAPTLRILALGRDGIPDIAADALAAPQLIAEAQPFALLLLGDTLPAALVSAAAQARLPVVLGHARLDPADGWGLRATLQRQLLGRITRLLLADRASMHAARRAGVAGAALRQIGLVSPVPDPLGCVETERAALAEALYSRRLWLAAALPEAEETAVIDAHRAALRQSHRALLILSPAQSDRGLPLARALESQGFAVALRSAEVEPGDDIQVLIADDPTELGLWYRLAPVCFIGGTLSPGSDAQAGRTPFEPAALGAAIIHGPATGAYKAAWDRLIAAQATRPVADAAALTQAVADLAQPDQVASLAARAWAVCTDGAEVALQIANTVLDMQPRQVSA